MRLIDADALKEILKRNKHFFIDAWGGSFHAMSEKYKARCDEIDNCIEERLNAPTIEQPTGDLISRQAAIDVAKDVHNAVLCCEVSPSKSLLEVVKRLESLPTAEPKTKCIAQIRIDRDDIEDFVNEKVNEIVEKMKEPKTGKWLWGIEGYCYCSRCGKKPNDQTRTTDFCPNCGAKMGGGE